MRCCKFQPNAEILSGVEIKLMLHVGVWKFCSDQDMYHRGSVVWGYTGLDYAKHHTIQAIVCFYVLESFFGGDDE